MKYEIHALVINQAVEAFNLRPLMKMHGRNQMLDGLPLASRILILSHDITLTAIRRYEIWALGLDDFLACYPERYPRPIRPIWASASI